MLYEVITKPFRSGELVARIRAAIRAGEKSENEPVINIRNLEIDFINHTLKKNRKIVKLTSTEFSLISLLAKNQGRVLTHQYLV